ncbi:hypothetical protein EAE99_006658 [Botrytis elliptica]|nr:hypothetical protein EAE99_006658 [Botrytis elliptica]
MLWHHIGCRHICRPLSTPIAIHTLGILPASSRTLRLIQFKQRCLSTHTNSQKYDHFFRYTSGKWLPDGEKILSEKYQKFNVEALKRIAIESVGAKSCSSMTKISESGYNRVFELIMDNDSVAIARIPLRNLCPDCRATASEVATMDFARTILNIPLPKVYTWSAESNNPVDTDYIIMEEAPGISLADRNYECYKSVVSREELATELASRKKFVADIVAIEKKLLSVPSLQTVGLNRCWDLHGSIYFTEDWFSGCEKAEVLNDIPIELKKEVEESFVIGPRVEDTSWKEELSALRIDHGPWKTAHDFLKSQANNQIKWLSQSNLRESPKDSFFNSQHSPGAHIDLYNRFLDIHRFITPEDARMTQSNLWHTEIDSDHVFVKDGNITSRIDWQFAWTGPLFLQFDDPDFTKYNRAMKLKDFKEASPLAHDGSRVRRVGFGFSRKDLYELEIAEQSSLLNKMKNVPAANIVKLRQRLIKLERNWGKMEFNIPCPIHFTEEEVQNHIQEVNAWEDISQFWEEMKEFIDKDGYISDEDYQEGLESWRTERGVCIETPVTKGCVTLRRR